jgi:hypothetical protein
MTWLILFLVMNVPCQRKLCLTDCSRVQQMGVGDLRAGARGAHLRQYVQVSVFAIQRANMPGWNSSVHNGKKTVVHVGQNS